MAVPPWSDRRARIDGATFERVVAEILVDLGASLPDFRIERQELVKAGDGQYRIDVTARFTQLGAEFLVLVECKDHARPVEREDVQVLFDKIRSVGAHKAMLFSTNGFQSGALEYARAHGVALVRVVEGALTYETRGQPSGGAPPTPPPWSNIPEFVCQLISAKDDQRTHVSLVQPGRTEPLRAFLASA